MQSIYTDVRIFTGRAVGVWCFVAHVLDCCALKNKCRQKVETCHTERSLEVCKIMMLMTAMMLSRIQDSNTFQIDQYDYFGWPLIVMRRKLHFTSDSKVLDDQVVNQGGWQKKQM